MTIKIEINGIELAVDPGKMIIQAADDAGIEIPRFCYHKKLSVAANCRMCLVEVEKANKALPACATPVADGMKIHTASPAAKAAQRSVMEFLLINHPLDCPICDQGGECELQDLSMGYGEGVGRFSESKRVVKDKDIGALVKTDMTRCILCTRCVRFGQEIAGIKELGATGRGEHTEIGTYIEQSLSSELSGNIIDLCPVGALTSKPFRYKARAWELQSHASIAPHDAIGSNIEVHTRRGEVMRVVPRENESLNETWLSDRDRFSYLGLKHDERATTPMIKRDGQWQQVDWQTALDAAMSGIKSVIAKDGAAQVAGLASPTVSLEEGYLYQKMLRGLGVDNIDHRLRQQDTSSYQACQDIALTDIAEADSIVLIGSSIRSEQPILSHRIRQAALAGSKVHTLNFSCDDLLMPVASHFVANSDALLEQLSGVAKALLNEDNVDEQWQQRLANTSVSADAAQLAQQLKDSEKTIILVGELVKYHPQASTFIALVDVIASMTGSQFTVVQSANSKALTQVNVLPSGDGMDAHHSLQAKLKAYVLLGMEPELDCADPRAAMTALTEADCVVAMSSYVTETMLAYADVILPIASFVETSGTFVSFDGQWQQYNGVVAPVGESRPAWKVLRVLGNLAEQSGFDYVSSQDVHDEARDYVTQQTSDKSLSVPNEMTLPHSDLDVISIVPMYQVDNVVRRSDALANTVESHDALSVKMHPETAAQYAVLDESQVALRHDDLAVTLDLQLDETIAKGCLFMPMSVPAVADFAPAYSDVTVEAVGETL